MSFILVVDQFLDSPLFFSKITSLDVFFFIVSTVFFASVFCGLVSLVVLTLLTVATKDDG